MAEERTDKIFLAKLAEEMGRYEDMVGHMKDIIAMDSDDGLTVEERSLLSVAYKNVIGARRASWRVTYGLEQRYKHEAQETLATQASEYRKTIEKELVTYCSEVLELLDSRLIPKAKTTEYKVFFLKMRGDCYRYQAEIVVAGGDVRKDISDKAKKAYEEANDIAKEGLKATDPTRLGLTLNLSVFLYEILNQPQTACQIAQESFDMAMSELKENMNKDTGGTYDDTTMILQSMRDNLILWKSQDSSDDDEKIAKTETTEKKELKNKDKPVDTPEASESATDKEEK